MRDLTYAKAIEVAEHLKAIDYGSIYLRDEDPHLPWHRVTKIGTGCTYRLSMPTSISFEATTDHGLDFRWSIDIETRDANGTGTTRINRDLLRDVSRKLTSPMRQKYAEYLQSAVLGAVEKQAAEVREALGRVEDSADCIRGIVAYAQPA